MRVLLTGATGFVGKHLVEALVERGDETRALVRPGSDAKGLEALGVKVTWGDVTDRGPMEAAARGVDGIFHLAAPRRTSTAREHRAVSVSGTENVMRAALKSAVEWVVHCSTVGVHGRLRRLPTDESAPLRPESVYQSAKAEGERVVSRYVRRHRLPVVILRPTAIYGPGDLRSLRLYRTILSGRLVTLGPAAHPFHVVYVDDVVEALLRAMELREASGEAFIVADRGAIPLIGLFQAIAAAGGTDLRRRVIPAWPFVLAAAAARSGLKAFGRQAAFCKSVHFFTRPRSFDISKARREMGYRPQVAPDEGTQWTWAWYRDQGLL